MDYGFKVTTHGRELLAQLWAAGMPLDLCRVAVGSGQVEEGTNLATVHELLHYMAEGTVGDRDSQDGELFFTVQYNSNATEGLPAFMLREFIVYARDPSGTEVDFLYAALGDDANNVPAYSAIRPPSLREYPLALKLEDATEVIFSAPAGLVLHSELSKYVRRSEVDKLGGIQLELPFTIHPDEWQNAGTGEYPWYFDIADSSIQANWIPDVAYDEASMPVLGDCEASTCCESFDGYVRVKSAEQPEGDISGVCRLWSKVDFISGSVDIEAMTEAVAEKLSTDYLVEMSPEEVTQIWDNA